MDRCTLGRLLQQQPTKLKNLEDFEFDKKSPPLKGRNIIWSPTLQFLFKVQNVRSWTRGYHEFFTDFWGEDVKTLHLSERAKAFPLEVPVMESCMECGAFQLGSSSLLDSNVMNPGPGGPQLHGKTFFFAKLMLLMVQNSQTTTGWMYKHCVYIMGSTIYLSTGAGFLPSTVVWWCLLFCRMSGKRNKWPMMPDKYFIFCQHVIIQQAGKQNYIYL